jgi:putative MATE family efflux protein
MIAGRTAMRTDLTDLRRALAIAAPLVAFFIIQNVASLVVLARVGQLGASALAGVGLANVLFMGLLALLYGVDTAVQAQVARAVGAGAQARSAQSLMEGLAVGAPLGALLALATAGVAPLLLAGLTSSAAASAGADNLRGIAPSLVALGLTIPMNAYWIASGMPRISLGITAASSAVNVAFAWVLTPAFGAVGAGAAASIGAFVALALQVIVLQRLRGWAWLAQRPSVAGLLAIGKLGWPVSVQQALMQGVLMAAFAIIAQLGVAATAAASVLSSLTLFPTQICAGVGVATAVLVGQSLGRQTPAEARRWGWRMAGWGAVGMATIGLVAVLAPRSLLGLFIHDPAVVNLAVGPARLLGLMLGLDALGKILGYGLRGAGATGIATGVPFLFEAALQIPLIWWVGLKLGLGLTGMVATQVAMTVATAAVLAWIWRGERWTRVRMVGLEDERPTLPPDLARVVILGGAGAGKSTLARVIGERIGAPVIHLDRCVFGPGWATRDLPEQRRRLDQATQGDRWVVEGVYPELLRALLPQAQTVVWLEQPVWRRLIRSWRKTRKGRTSPRADRPDGCEESFDLKYVRQIAGFGRWTGRVQRMLGEAAPDAKVIVLRGDGETAGLLGDTPSRLALQPG